MTKASNMINKQIGKYLILNEISRGGMGIIFLGKHVTLNRYAAIKMLFPHLAGDIKFVKRFREEMTAMSRLKHPNIVDIFDYEQAFNTYFIIMEVVVGRSLEAILKEKGALSKETALGIVRQVLNALSFAHKNGILHRDIKPSNIMVNDQGLVKVLDFGIAKIIGGENLTQTGYMVGTPQYISPEQAEGKKAIPASDLYSLSVVLYEMLTGRPPFTGDTPVSVVMAHLKESPPRPRKINPAMSSALEKFILKGLAKKPKDRYQTAEEMLKALDMLRSPTGTHKVLSKYESPVSSSAPALPDKVTKVDVHPDDPYLDEKKQSVQDGQSTQGPFKRFVQFPSAFLKMNRAKQAAFVLIGLFAVMAAWLLTTQTGKQVSSDSFASIKMIFSGTTQSTDIQKSAFDSDIFAVPVHAPGGPAEIFGIHFEMIPAGTFTMGAKPGTTGSLDDSPDHEVELDTYFISRYEITNAQYEMFTRDTGYRSPPHWKNNRCPAGKENLPVSYVTWFDAMAFCKWLSQKVGLSFRLPTEAEWERAAYSGGTYPWGDRWTGGNANVAQEHREGPMEVGSYESDHSLTGLYDMGGNVREWIYDYYSMSAYAISTHRNPRGPRNGKKKVVRGGSFKTSYKVSRVTHRDCMKPHRKDADLGFRIVLESKGRLPEI